MRLFAYGRRYHGMADEIVDLGGGLRRHISHEARVLAAWRTKTAADDCRATLALNRDQNADGSMDWLEDGRV